MVIVQTDYIAVEPYLATTQRRGALLFKLDIIDLEFGHKITQ